MASDQESPPLPLEPRSSSSFWARRPGSGVADEEEAEQADAVHRGVAAGHAIAPTTAEGSSEEKTTGPATALLLLPSEVVGSFSKEALARLCKGSSAPATLLLPLERARAQAVSPTDTSTEHLMSYLQDPKSVRLLAEKTREIWKVSYIDGVEECFTALPMHLLVAEEKISAPTKRLHCNSVVGEVLQGSSEETKTGPATALLLLPSEVVRSFSKEVLGWLCKGSSAPATLLLPLEHARAQAVSPTDNSSEHLMSYLQDTKSVRLLAEKTREIWKVSHIDSVEECFTALPMHLLVSQDKILAPTKRLHCNSVVGELLQFSYFEILLMETIRKQILAFFIICGWRYECDKYASNGNTDVNEADPETDTEIYLCRSVSSSTQEPRNVWLVLKNGAGNFQGKIRDLTPLHKVAAKRSYKTLQGSSEETAVLDTVMLLPSSAAVRNFSKETSSTQEPRVQVISSMDNSTVDFLSYLQDPKAVRLLAEKTREIWELPCKDNVEECVTALAMLLLLVEEKISAPVSVVVEGISTKRSCYNVTIVLQLSGSSRTGSLLLKNIGTIFVGCLPFSVDSAEFGLMEKSIFTGLKRGSLFQIRSIIFVEFDGEEGVVDARYQMLGKRMDVKGAVAGPYLPAELKRNTSWSQSIRQWTKANRNMLDGELCEKHNIHKWCPLPVQCLPSWFLMSGNWLPAFLVGETEKLKERYPLNDLESDSGATYVVELGHGVHGYDKPRHPMHFLPGFHRMCVVPGRNGPATNTVHLPLLLEPKSELAELTSDYQYPISPLTANITGDSHDTESQQLDPCSESSNVESQQGNECRLTNVDSHHVGDCADNDSLAIPIFVKHFSGELTLTVSLDQSSQHLMHLYVQKTKTKLECQYFVYGRKILEPDHTLLFYGLKRDTTVHVCTRLLGGTPPTLKKYLDEKSKMFTVVVTLPDGRKSLQMTMEGCQFLSSWIKCFTTAFSRGMSWNGQFELEDFKCVDGHIRIIKGPKRNCASGSVANDLAKFVGHVTDILRSNKTNLVSKYPPYIEEFISFVNGLIPILSVTNVLSSEDTLFLETHVCCMTCYARERLIIELFRKYEGRDVNEASDWEKAIDDAKCSKDWVSYLTTESSFFTYVIKKGEGKSVHYNNSRTSAFIFIKDIVLHATDSHTEYSNAAKLDAIKLEKGLPPQLGDGIELMIPAGLGNFLPTIILNLIKKKVDISAELLAAIQCACTLCDSSH